jgi:hypothetical protein
METAPPSAPLSHYLWLLRRHWWRILGVVTLCVAATAIIFAARAGLRIDRDCRYRSPDAQRHNRAAVDGVVVVAVAGRTNRKALAARSTR